MCLETGAGLTTSVGSDVLSEVVDNIDGDSWVLFAAGKDVSEGCVAVSAALGTVSR